MVIYWSQQAQDSLHEVYCFYQEMAGDNKARQIVSEIRNEVRYLLIFPQIGNREMIDEQITEFRCIRKHKCKIYYKIYVDYISILLVWDIRRDPQLLR